MSGLDPYFLNKKNGPKTMKIKVKEAVKTLAVRGISFYDPSQFALGETQGNQPSCKMKE